MATYHEAGRYRARVAAAALSKATTGTDQVRLSLELLGIYGEGQDRQLYQAATSRFPPEVYLALTEKTIEWVQKVLTALGFEGDFGNLQQMVGWEGDVLCQHETAQAGKHQGEEVERWSILVNGGPREAEPIDAREARRLNATFGKLFKKVPPQNRAELAQRRAANGRATATAQHAAAHQTMTEANAAEAGAPEDPFPQGGEDSIPF
jgi:hypothetical protein